MTVTKVKGRLSDITEHK